MPAGVSKSNPPAHSNPQSGHFESKQLSKHHEYGLRLSKCEQSSYNGAGLSSLKLLLAVTNLTRRLFPRCICGLAVTTTAQVGQYAAHIVRIRLLGQIWNWSLRVGRKERHECP